MNLKSLTLIGAALLLSAPMFGSTYFVGYEDSVKGDYDYNDIVFSLSGNGLTLNSHGDSFYSQPKLNDGGSPFWNNLSYDNPSTSYNIGFCIYGGGACNGGKALDAGADFLASNPTSHTGSANNVTFSTDGKTALTVYASVATDMSTLGYYLVNDPSHSFKQLKGSNGAYNFTPSGDFGLVAYNYANNESFFSQPSMGTADSVSHFAFFGMAAPEPGMTSLVGIGLAATGLFLRRRKASK